MFVKVLALERGEGEGDVLQNGAMTRIEIVCTEVVSSNLHERIVRRGESSIFEDLGMDMP
jgi:hypothetical protein